jgi:DNA-binding XRE family transcriptional regulator
VIRADPTRADLQRCAGLRVIRKPHPARNRRAIVGLRQSQIGTLNGTPSALGRRLFTLANALGYDLALIPAGGRMIQLDGLRVYLTERRKLLDLSQDEVALRMDVTQPAVSFLENGGTQDPSVRTVARWASALGLTLSLHFAEHRK